MEGNAVDVDQFQSIARLPGVDQLRGQLDAALVAEADVDQRDVRVQALDQLTALGRRAGRAEHLDAVAAEQQLETLAEGLVIFDKNKA